MHTLCPVDAVGENQSRGLTLEGCALILVRQAGALHLYRNRCPHRGINLEWVPDRFLDADNNYIQCASHGALFTIATGECVYGPCQGQALTAVPFVIEDGEVRVDPEHLSSDPPAAAAPG
ncbi:Rieske 2Fe-2S domain-containing protein [Motiliproteus sp. SC1-56]|uniref:Rieske (2Fe-2S) protein n=1 Tax=Motiliproteus sp. SC1-56 TaxID=2799565 RepID=UPI001A8E4F9F|nr:Rieske 2Fe-2S domain-containing protein [Motiliproteus sp. SC1-56]